MDDILELKTPEATYFLISAGYMHFGIDCACGGKSGSRFKNASHGTEHSFDSYQLSRVPQAKYEHTFYVTSFVFEIFLEPHSAENPLIVVCNDCRHEFPFTIQSFADLEERIRAQGITPAPQDPAKTKPEDSQ